MTRVVLALDVGQARIGVASGKLGAPLAFGRGVIRRTSAAADVTAVVTLARREHADHIVVGLPLRSDGGDSQQTRRVRSFARTLENAGLEVVFEDERFTTRLATRTLQGSGLPQRKRRQKGRLDETSAVLILESYLQRTRCSP